MKRLGVEFHTGSKVQGLERHTDGAVVKVKTPEKELRMEADRVLVSVGRRPSTAGLNLELAGVKLDSKGFIAVDNQMRTNVHHIFAVGDVTGVPFLAHRASQQGKIAAEVMAGQSSAFENVVIPSAIFTDPEVGFAGYTEGEAKAEGHSVVVGKFPFAALGRALAMGEADGYVKVVADSESKQILGAQIVGPQAADLIAEVALAMEMGATLDDLALTIHAHPTLPEAIMEAADAAMGKSVHVVRK